MMSKRSLNARFIGVGFLTTLAAVVAAAMGADAQVARETFAETAERWGIWAAMSVGLVFVAVCALIYLVWFVITTMAEIIDDNTFSHLHLSNMLAKRPCLHDSDLVVDIKGIEDDSGPVGATGRRVLARRRERKERHDKE